MANTDDMMSNEASICSAVMHRGGASRMMLPFPEITIFYRVDVGNTRAGFGCGVSSGEGARAS